MINGLDIYYSKKVGRGLEPVGSNNKQTQKANGLKSISKGKGCKKIHGEGLKILQ